MGASILRADSSAQNDESKETDFWSCLYLREQPFTDIVPRAVLVGDSHIVAQFKKVDSYLELNRKLQSFMPTLFMAQTSSALDRGGLPGERTLHSPLFPSLHLKAISSARCVLSFHLEPLLVAIANRVPAIFISGREGDETLLAKRMGIPTVVGQDPAKLVAEIEMYFTHYSWKKIDDFCRQIKQELNLPIEISAPRGNLLPSHKTFNVCTITDFNYLPFFLGFVENVNRASNGNFRCHVLALDPQVSQAINKIKLASKVDVTLIQKLWTPEEWEIVRSRSMGNRAFSTKPRLISKVLKEVGGPVFYCDSDVFFFESVSQLQSVMGDDQLVLFPHLNDQYPAAQLDGLFNAGMIAAAPGAEPFLDWWGELCLRNCGFDHEHGLVGDQAYLNLAPILFEKVKIYKGHNHNVARWNSQTLRLDLDLKDKETPIIEECIPVSTYHAAFCDERGVYQMKFLWDQLVSFFSPAYSLGTSKALADNVKFQQAIYWSFWDYVSKIDRVLQRPLLLKLFGNQKYDPDGWFSEKGRMALKVLVSVKTLMNQLRIKSKEAPVAGPKSGHPSVSEAWVESNLKALKSPPNSSPETAKVA